MFRRMLVLAVGLAVCAAACDNYTPLKVIANRSPAVQSLVAFPTTIRPGDSAVVVCGATDPDGDTLVYDWSSDCRMVRKGAGQYDDGTSYDRRDRSLVVYPGACNRAPEDTGWVRCEVRDHRGGGAYAGVVRIVVRQ